MQTLPVELHLRILGYLTNSVSSLLRMSEVNQYWCSLARDQLLWARIVSLDRYARRITLPKSTPHMVSTTAAESASQKKLVEMEDQKCPLRDFPAAKSMEKYRAGRLLEKQEFVYICELPPRRFVYK